MVFLASVPARVLVWRRVAAERDAARLARPQMHPPGPNGYAGFALPPARDLDVRYRLDVGAGLWHIGEPTMAKNRWPDLT